MSPKHYVGRACPHGHFLRYMKSGNCVSCTTARARKRYRCDPERQRAASAKWRAKNRPRERARFSRWYEQRRSKCVGALLAVT